VRKKIKNLIKSKKQKKIINKTEPQKKPIRIFKKIFGSVQFQFRKPETEKLNQTESNPLGK